MSVYNATKIGRSKSSTSVTVGERPLISEQRSSHQLRADKEPSPLKPASPIANIPQPTTGYVSLLVVSSIASSVLLILSMKNVLGRYNFGFVLTLSACHFACTGLFSRLSANKLFKPKRSAMPRIEVCII
jgi:hypothetical protein